MPTSSPGIEAASGRSPLVREALEIARKAHAGQIRNASRGRPYIDHPVAVAERVGEHLDRDEVLAAALLHDVVEDSELDVDDIRARCGDHVADLVAVLTDDEAIESYSRRKQDHRDRVEAAGGEAMTIYAADKLTNVEMLRDAHSAEGEESVAGELKVPLDEKVEIWDRDLEMLRRHAGDSPAVRSLASSLDDQLSRLAEERGAARVPPGKDDGAAATRTTDRRT
jgi:(p)ppGpp synthase/HD superfamily hydrolase